VLGRLGGRALTGEGACRCLSPLSVDLRERVVAAVTEGASFHQAAARFGISVSMCGRPLRCKKNLRTGAARDRVLPCVRPLMRRDHMPRARMGVRGSGPHQCRALAAPCHGLVLLTPPHRRCAIPVLRPPHAVDSLAAITA
jgi:hypothetical protein